MHISPIARRALCCSALLLGCAGIRPPKAASSAAPPRRYELKDFFAKPQQASFSLSPDGKTLAFLAPYERRQNVFVMPCPAGGNAPDFAAAKRITSETARDIAGYFWKGDGHIIYGKDFGGDENFHAVAVDVQSGEVKDLTPYAKVRADILDDLKDVPGQVLIQHNQRDPKIFDVYRVDVRTGGATLVAQNPGNISGWVTDHQGRVRVATTTDGVNSSLLFRDTEQEPFRVVLTTDFKTTLAPQFFTFDDKNLYALSNRGRDKTALVTLDPRTGQESAPIFQHPEVDLDAVSYSRLRKVLTLAQYQTWKAQQHFFDAQFQGAYEKLRARFPGMEVGISSMNLAEDKYVVSTYSDRTRGARYVYDLRADALTKLAVIDPQLRAEDMAPMKPVTYTTRDGLAIQGYLTLPVGREAKNLPVIVNPHGGPWYRDSWGFNPEIQFLANRGFAVFQMNFRGSTGYGRAFWEKSFKQWGRAMQDDVTDGVRWLVQEGIADPKRIGIYGGSYGGYATLAGVTFTPDLYAAAVDYVGVANLFTFMKTIPPYWEPYLAMIHEMVGHPEKDQALLTAASPVFHADRIVTPLFVAQGANDPRVNKAESDQMVEALRKRGVQVDYMVKDDEGHGFHNEENQFDFYGAMEAFFTKHLMK